MNTTVRPHAPVTAPDGIGHNTTNNSSFDTVIAARLSRRNLFRLGVDSAASAVMLSACGGGDDEPTPAPPPAPGPPSAPAPLVFNFNPVAKKAWPTPWSCLRATPPVCCTVWVTRSAMT